MILLGHNRNHWEPSALFQEFFIERLQGRTYHVLGFRGIFLLQTLNFLY